MSIPYGTRRKPSPPIPPAELAKLIAEFLSRKAAEASQAKERAS